MDGAARTMHFACHVKHVWGGKIGEDPRELLKLHGVGCKVLMLMLQDAWAVHEFKGTVCDSHVTEAILNLSLTTVNLPEGLMSRLWRTKLQRSHTGGSGFLKNGTGTSMSALLVQDSSSGTAAIASG